MIQPLIKHSPVWIHVKKTLLTRNMVRKLLKIDPSGCFYSIVSPETVLEALSA